MIGGCGLESAQDHTARFIRCLQHAGGRRITAPGQLDSYPSADPQQGVGAGLESVSYYSVDVAVGHGDLRQSLVFVERLPYEPGSTPMPEPGELLRRARHGHAGVHALVVMPAGEDWDTPIENYEDVAAPGQAVP